MLSCNNLSQLKWCKYSCSLFGEFMLGACFDHSGIILKVLPSYFALKLLFTEIIQKFTRTFKVIVVLLPDELKGSEGVKYNPKVGRKKKTLLIGSQVLKVKGKKVLLNSFMKLQFTYL